MMLFLWLLFFATLSALFFDVSTITIIPFGLSIALILLRLHHNVLSPKGKADESYKPQMTIKDVEQIFIPTPANIPPPRTIQIIHEALPPVNIPVSIISGIMEDKDGQDSLIDAAIHNLHSRTIFDEN